MSEEQKNSPSGDSLIPLTPYTSLLTIARLNQAKNCKKMRSFNILTK